MTNKDLYRALSDVDANIVLDAQPAPKRTRPVWARAVAIAACACLTVGVLAALPFIAKWAEPDTPDVPGETVTPEQTEQQTEVPTAGQVIGDPIQEPIFLYVPGLAMTDSKDKISNHFHKSGDYGVHTDRKEIKISALQNKTKKNPFSGNEAIYQYSRCSLLNNQSEEIGTFYSIFDRYKDGETIIDYLHGTDQIAFYSSSRDQNESYPVLTELEVRSYAESFILSIMPLETFKNFSFRQMEIDALGRYALSYVRYIEGYRTDETISIFVDRSGHISCYNAYNVGKYNSLVDTIDKSSLDQAHNALLQQLFLLDLSELSCGSPKIITSSTGELFLELAINYVDSNGFSRLDCVIISVDF